MKRFFSMPVVTPAILVVLAFVAGVIESPYFLDARYLLDASSLYVEGGLLALGMTLVIVAGQIDLSVASMMALVAAVFARLSSSGMGFFESALCALLLGAILGGINGMLVGPLKLPSFVVTLGTMAAYRGIAQAMLGADSQTVPPGLVGIDEAHLLGLPWPLIILSLMAILTGVLLHRTVLGRWIFSTGTNARAAYASGVPTGWVVASVFAISGVMAAVGAILIDSRLGVARYDHATGLEVDVITAVVLGGASIYGGKGTVLGTMMALLLIALVRTGMGLANVTAEYQLAAVGALLVVAVVAGNLTSNRKATA